MRKPSKNFVHNESGSIIELKKSIKVYGKAKADYPANTIKRIKEGFAKLGYNLDYRSFCYDRALGIYSGTATIKNTFFSTNGKGLSYEAAKASAFAELAERFSADMFIDPNYFSDFIRYNANMRVKVKENRKAFEKGLSYSFLRGYAKPSTLTEGHIATIKRILGRAKYRKRLDLFSENIEVIKHWVDAYSLTNKKVLKIPIKLVNRISGSNGLACGNTIEEAIVQGINEVFERYCLITIIKRKKKVPSISIESIKSESIRRIIDHFNRNNIDIIIKDFTLGNAFPVVGVIFINRNLEHEHNPIIKSLYYKKIRAGASQNINEAVVRCFTEELQGYSKTAYFSYEREHKIWQAFKMDKVLKYRKPEFEYKYLFRNYEIYDDIGYLEKSDNDIDINDLRFKYNNDYMQDIREYIRICNKQNMELMIVNYTHKKLNIPVIRVVIPGVSDFLDYYLSSSEAEVIFSNREMFNAINIQHLYELMSSNNKRISINDLQNIILSLTDYIEKYPLHETLYLNRYGLRDISVLNVLAHANIALGNYHDAIRYLKIKKAYNNRVEQIEGIISKTADRLYGLPDKPFWYKVLL